MAWYYILLICAGAAALLLFALAIIVDKVAFGARCDKNPLLTYFDYSEADTSAIPVSVERGNEALNGYIYNLNGGKDLIIFCHGLGPGHIAYTTEVKFFCQSGYTVLALDYRGCNLSSGKSIRGLYSGVDAVISAVQFARGDERLKGRKIFTVGHSWGGYSALCATKYVPVDGAVAISAPLTPVKTVYYPASASLTKPVAALLCPFWYVINAFKFGFRGNLNAAKCVKNSGVPALIIHGDGDTVVPLKISAYGQAEGDNIRKYLAVGKNHNPYNSPSAQKLMCELSARIANLRKMSDEEKLYFKNFDYVAATQEDGEVMNTILRFLQDCD